MALRVLYIVIFVLACFVGYKGWSLHQVYKDARTVPPEQMVGTKGDADLTVVFFFDYECPYCKQMYPVLLEAVKQDRKAQIVLRPMAPPDNNFRAKIALAAGEQNVFLPMHDKMISAYGIIDNKAVESMSRQMGIDFEKLIADSQSEKVQQTLNENGTLAAKLGIYSTPTLVMNNIVYTPAGQMPDANDLMRLFNEARGNPGS